MVKKDSLEFLKSILDSLSAEPKNILEISKDAKTSWESTKNALERLSELGIVIKDKRGERDYYLINPNPIAKNTNYITYDTYFNLPINNEDKEKIHTYFSYIKELWNKETGKNPTITQLYKVLAKLNYDLNLGLPIGWYLYGLNSVVIYETEIEYKKQFVIEKETKDKIIEIITKYKEFNKIRDLKKFQYKEFDKKSYLMKEEILDNFYYNSPFISKELIGNVKKLISFLFKDNIDVNTIQYLNEFLGLMYELKNTSNDLVLEAKEEIIETFKEMWKLVAMNYYKNDLKRMYEKEILNKCFEPEIKKQKENLLNNFSILEEITEIFNKYPDSELKKLQGSGKKLENTKSNKELLNESLNENSGDLFREFNLN